jgi:hypothetical protein
MAVVVSELLTLGCAVILFLGPLRAPAGASSLATGFSVFVPSSVSEAATFWRMTGGPSIERHSATVC